jgi:uncharacterized protein YbjQ (UPF0145 family)
MILTTSDRISQKKITRTLGLVRGNSIRGRHLGKDLIAHFRNAVGGEITEYTKMMAEAREQALDRMTEDARELGANAIVAVRFATTMTMPGAAEFLAYGTAVTIEDAPDEE